MYVNFSKLSTKSFLRCRLLIPYFLGYSSLRNISRMPIKCAYFPEKSIHKLHCCISRTGQQTCSAVYADRADIVFIHTAPTLPSLCGDSPVLSPRCSDRNSDGISHLALYSDATTATAAQNIGPVSTHRAALHRSNSPPTHGDLVCVRPA